MNNEYPSWYRLIYNWCKIKHRSGLSIPFLIGTHGGTISELLLTVSNSDFPEKVILKYCNDINAYVLGFDDPVYSIGRYLTKMDNLIIYDDKLEELGDLDSIAEYLTTLYHKPIAENKFSRNGFLDSWQNYTADDLKLISDALDAS